MIDRTAEWSARHPVQRQAHMIVRRAVARGELVRPDRCLQCGWPGKVVAFHADPRRAMDVSWLCYRCARNARLLRSGRQPVTPSRLTFRTVHRGRQRPSWRACGEEKGNGVCWRPGRYLGPDGHRRCGYHHRQIVG